MKPTIIITTFTAFCLTAPLSWGLCIPPNDYAVTPVTPHVVSYALTGPFAIIIKLFVAKPVTRLVLAKYAIQTGSCVKGGEPLCGNICDTPGRSRCSGGKVISN